MGSDQDRARTHANSVGRTLAVVRQVRLPVRIRNLHEYPVTIGRYQKLGKLFQLDKDVHGARDVQLTPGANGVVKVGLMDVCNGEEAKQAFKVLKLAERPDLMPEEQGSRRPRLRRTQAKWFSTLDLTSGYWQVEMDPVNREKTAFTAQLGLFEFQCMPFGLCNAPATFQKVMQQCLGGQIREPLLVYLDDIIVYSPDFKTHL